ncbi:MAG: urea ABC transporter permease subunit UrtC, partial [Gammaproteobacteria bacterium]|nr:urea ABC transporter permease subunit UrtC [Gammaproteobacteria bacterium]
MMNLLKHDRGGRWLIGSLLLAIFLVPILNALPASSSLHIPTYSVSLLGKYLTLALLAVAVDLVWGYLGIL